MTRAIASKDRDVYRTYGRAEAKLGGSSDIMNI